MLNNDFIDIARTSITALRKDESLPVSIQLRFLDTQKRDRFDEEITKIKRRVKGLSVDTASETMLLLHLTRGKARAIALAKYIKLHIDESLPANVYLIIIIGKRDEREILSKTFHKIGMRRGWLKQSFIKKLDEVIINDKLKFELLSLVYELRMYRDRIFTAAGTANFWPKGVESIREALEEYLLPIEKARGYYVFIKSLRFRLLREGISVGTYSIDRWGRITIAPRSDAGAILRILPIIASNILNNYIEYKLLYTVSLNKVRGFTTYYLERANSIYLSAVDPGPDFFNTIRLMISKPSIWNKRLIILPIEVGNPRLVSRIIDKQTGMGVTLIATYNGIRLLPAPGSTRIDAEMIDNILAMFRNLVIE